MSNFIHHFYAAVNQNYQYKIDDTAFERLAEGDEQAFGEIVHYIYNHLFSFVVSLVKSEEEANDLLQEVFLKIWVHHTSFSSIINPMGWIYTVIANTASNHIRARIRQEVRIREYQLRTSSVERMEEQMDAKFTQSLIDEAVNALPSKKRQVFLLSKKEGLSRKEIAERLNVSENTVRNQLSDAVRFLRERLNYNGDLSLPVFFILYFFI